MPKFISPGSQLSTRMSSQMGTTGPRAIGSQMGTTGQVPIWELLYKSRSGCANTAGLLPEFRLHSAPSGARWRSS